VSAGEHCRNASRAKPAVAGGVASGIEPAQFWMMGDSSTIFVT